MRTAISYQLSAISFQLSAVSCQSNAQNEEVPSATINAEYGMHDAKG
jgi:hypothetical protein